MAEKSFLQIKKNVHLASLEGSDFSDKINPNSTTTKSVEHFHSLAHRKSTVQTVHEYIQSWSVIVREAAKSLCSWSFQMFSGFKSSYYLKPEDSRIPLGDVPMMPKLDSMNNLSPEENEKARETCKEYKALPQASTRAFTSKFNAGTLPLQAYLQPDPGNEVESDTDGDKNTVSADDEVNSDVSADYVDESPEWDSGSSSDSDIDEDITEGDVNETVGFIHVNQGVGEQ